jgi:hypothetical protein
MAETLQARARRVATHDPELPQSIYGLLHDCADALGVRAVEEVRLRALAQHRYAEIKSRDAEIAAIKEVCALADRTIKRLQAEARAHCDAVDAAEGRL